MLNKSYDGIIFDLDGTMWDTRKPICEAWNIILSRHEEIHRTPIVEADLNDCMGLPMYDIAAKLFPDDLEMVDGNTGVSNNLKNTVIKNGIFTEADSNKKGSVEYYYSDRKMESQAEMEHIRRLHDRLERMRQI